MTIRKGSPKGKRVLDLSGPDGNAFVLLGLAQSCLRQSGVDGAEATRILNEMRMGDYDNLVQVFDRYFGGLFDIYRAD